MALPKKSNLASLGKLISDVQIRDQKAIWDRVCRYGWLLPSGLLVEVDISLRTRVLCESIALLLDIDKAKEIAGYEPESDLEGLLGEDGGVYLNKLLNDVIAAETETDQKVIAAAVDAVTLARAGTLKGSEIAGLVSAIQLRAKMRGMLVVEQQTPASSGLGLLIRSGSRPITESSNGSH